MFLQAWWSAVVTQSDCFGYFVSPKKVMGPKTTWPTLYFSILHILDADVHKRVVVDVMLDVGISNVFNVEHSYQFASAQKL